MWEELEACNFCGVSEWDILNLFQWRKLFGSFWHQKEQGSFYIR